MDLHACMHYSSHVHVHEQTLDLLWQVKEERAKGVLNAAQEDALLLAYIQAFQAASRQVTWCVFLCLFVHICVCICVCMSACMYVFRLPVAR